MTLLKQRSTELNELISNAEFTLKGHKVDELAALDYLYTFLTQHLKNKRNIFVIGNGGSAGIASHHVVDLVNVIGLKAQTLSDNNLVTCFGNDYGYPFIYSRSLNILASENDLLIAISSSGQSENILNACKVMHQKKGVVWTLSGFDEENPLRSAGDFNIWTGAHDYGLVETAHFSILHSFVDGWASRKLYMNQKCELSV